MDNIDRFEEKRLELNAAFEQMLGSKNVYIQPPSNVRMKYPAIVYTRIGIDPIRADNGVHKLTTEYEVVVIDSAPNSNLVYQMAYFPLCRHTRHYEQDNLNHDVFRIFY